MSIKIGDFVKGITNNYDITNTKMTRGVVTDVRDGSIVVRVLDHNDDKTGMYIVDPEKFEVIGHQKQFDRADVLKLLKDACKKAILDYDLRGADLSHTDLSYTDLSYTDLSYTDLNGAILNGAVLNGAVLKGADLRGADLDYSCYPLSCGSLHLKADKRLACQLAYHLCSLQCDDADYIKMRNSILDFANQFHRVNECGELEEMEI